VTNVQSVGGVVVDNNPKLKRRIIRKPMNKLISDGLKSVQVEFNNSISDVVINIGLILAKLGIAPPDENYVFLELTTSNLRLIKDGSTFLVFTVKDETRYKIFHADIEDNRINSNTFLRGKWEDTLEDLASKVREAADGEKEEGGDQ